MMLLLMFSVHDSVSGIYDRPFVARAEGDAVRSFGDIAKDKEHPIGKHPEHFSLFHVGMWNDNTGMIDPVAPTHVVSAIDLTTYESPAVHAGLSGNGEIVETLPSEMDDNGRDPRNYGGTE